MKIIWSSPERQAAARADVEFENRVRTLHFWQRMDAVILTFVAMLVVGCGILFFFGVQFANGGGLFDLEVSRPLTDARLLINVRDQITEHPLLDAIFHPPDQSLYVAQANGSIHKYTPATGLWNTVRPFSEGALQNPAVKLLRSGCGADPAHTLPDTCADPNSVWGMTANGGLVRQNNSIWNVVYGDSAFVGARGKPIENADLTTAALSRDGKWLLVGTEQDGIGLYDTQTRSWVRIEREMYHALPDLQVTHLVWAQNRFWIGGPKGLAVLEPDRRAPKLTAVPAGTGRVLDLDVAANELDDATNERVWALLSRPCQTVGTTCLWLGAFSDPVTVQAMMNEENVYPRLNGMDLIFAQYHPERRRLVVAGEAGIYSYDTQLHAWTRLFDGNVKTALPFPDKRGFYVGYVGGVGAVNEDGFQPLGALEDQTIIKLTFTARPELLALAERVQDRAVYSFPLTANAPPTPVFQTSSTTFDPALFRNAVVFDNTVVFNGPQGIVLHDIVARRFQDIPVNALPSWLAQADSWLVNAGNFVYGLLSPNSSGSAYYALPSTSFVSPAYLTNDIGAEKPQSLPGPVTQFWRWDRDSVGILGDQGSAFRLTPQGAYRITGAPLPSLNDTRWFDAAAHGTNLYLATDKGLWRYDGQTRDWDTAVGLPANAQPREVVEFAGQILARTDKGALVLAGNSPSALIPSDALQNDNSALSDVMRAGDSLYLAGQGRVDLYDMHERRVTGRWILENTTEAVRLQGIVNGLPLSQVQDRAYLGENLLDGNAGAVINLSIDANTIWTVREAEGTRYLKGYRYSGTSIQDMFCFYRAPFTNANVQELTDARRLSNGVVATLTNAGLWFYHPSAHSWYPVPPEFADAGGRLHQLGKYLVLIQPHANESRLTFIAEDSISTPSSCERGAVRFSAERVTALAASVDELNGRVGWLTKEGAVLEWQGGKTTLVLPPVTRGPAAHELRRVFAHLSDLYFATSDAVWKYEPAIRQWTRFELRGVTPGSVADLNIEFENDNATVVARGNDGRFYLGTIRPNDSVITLTEIFSPPGETFRHDPNSLLDVQMRGDGLWTFVLQDRIRYFDPRARKWLADAELETDATLQFGRISQWPVAVGENGRVWWIAEDNSSHPTKMRKFALHAQEQTALDDGGNLWRWQPSGTLLRCTPPYTENDCVRAAPETFVLDPAQVRSAYGWQGIEWFESTTGLRAFDPKLNSQVELPDTAAQFQDVTLRRVVGNELWLAKPNELLILTYANQSVQATLTGNVQMNVLDERNDGWAQIDGQWLRRAGNEWSAPRLPNGQTADEAKIRVFANEGAATTGVGTDGALYVWADALRPSGWRLPQAIAPSAVTTLYRADAGSWWARAGKRFYHLTRGLCPTPAKPSPVPTDVATAQPSPIPASEPCLVIDWDGALPNTLSTRPIRLIRQLGNGELALWSEAGTSVGILRDASGVFHAVETTDLFPPLRGTVRDDWQSWKSFVQTLADGSYAFNPITGLTRNSLGELVAQRPRGETGLGAQGSLSFDLAPVLNVGWLEWERGAHSFIVTTPSGRASLMPEQFIREGALPIERIEAILAPSPTRLYAANAYGITSFVNSSLALDDPGITFQPFSFGSPLAAVRGQFYERNGQLSPSDTRLQAPILEYPIRFQDLELVETIRAQQVRAQVRVEGRPYDILTDSGFLWDAERRGLAYENGVLRLASGLGIGPSNRIENFFAEPTTAAPGQIVSEDTTLYFHAGANWFARLANRWQAHADPTATRALFQDARWNWSVQNSKVRVTLNATPYNFSADLTPAGYGFSSDRLLAASSANGQLYVATAAFGEMGITADALADWSAARGAPIAADAFDTFTRPDGQMQLVRRLGSEISEWNNAQQQFDLLASSANPYAFRPLAESGRLRFRLEGRNVIKELRLDTAAGPGGWVPFELVERRFPFDVVTSLAVFENQLQIGTVAGLETHGAPFNLSVSGINSLFDLRSGGGSPAPITRVGTPYARPDVLMVQSTTTCVERRATANFAACQDVGQLDNRLRVRNDFWEWTRRADELAHGSYRNATGQPMPDEIAPYNGRLAHDEIAQVSVCQGRAATLWKNGWLTVYPQSGLELPNAAQTFAFDKLPTRLSCIEHEVALQQARLAAGLYLEFGVAQVLAFSGRGWAPVSSTQATEVIDRAAHPRLYDHVGLRLLGNTASYQFEQQTLNGEWRPLVWKQGHLDLDEWNEFVIVNNQLWAATRAGLTTFGRDPNGRAILGPDTLIVIREPSIEGKPCALSDFVAEGSSVTVRCNYDSRHVYKGNLDGSRDENVLARASDDPFVEQQLVAQETNGTWLWKRVGYADGSQGGLESVLDTRAVELNSGRFGFDELTSTTFYTWTLAEIATAHGGAWQAEADRFGTLDWKNPTSRRVDTTAVTQVFKTRVGEQIGLCFKLETQYARVVPGAEPQLIETCSEYLGADTLWAYTQNESKLEIFGKAASIGSTARLLQAGRFTDDIVVGLPVASWSVQARSYWIPTRAGIVHLDGQLLPFQLIAPPFSGLAAMQVPTSLLLPTPSDAQVNDADAPAPFYVGTDGIYQLLPTQTRQAVLPAQILADHEPLEITRAAGKTLKLIWEDKGQRHWAWLDAETFAVLGLDQVALDAQAFDDYEWMKAECGSRAAQLNLQFLPDEIKIADTTARGQTTIRYGLGFALQSAVPVRDRIYLIGQNDVREVNLGAVLRRLCGR